MKNWKTTLVGIIGGGAISVDALIEKGLNEGWQQMLAGLIVALLGILARDHNVTGGTK